MAAPVVVGIPALKYTAADIKYTGMYYDFGHGCQVSGELPDGTRTTVKLLASWADEPVKELMCLEIESWFKEHGYIHA